MNAKKCKQLRRQLRDQKFIGEVLYRVEDNGMRRLNPLCRRGMYQRVKKRVA